LILKVTKKTVVVKADTGYVLGNNEYLDQILSYKDISENITK